MNVTFNVISLCYQQCCWFQTNHVGTEHILALPLHCLLWKVSCNGQYAEFFRTVSLYSKPYFLLLHRRNRRAVKSHPCTGL